MSVAVKKHALVYTDGSSYQNHGGWAAVVATFDQDEPVVVELSGYSYPTTNNRMELQAAISGLEHLAEQRKVFLAADSAYVLNTLEQKWYLNWHPSRVNWDLWMKLVPLVEFHDVEFVKVVAHSKLKGDRFNERADKLASEARRMGMEEQNV